MNLEDDLKRALRRQSPPAGFAGRVLQRIEQEEAGGRRTRRPVWWRAAAASVTLAAILGGYATHRVAEHRRGEHAKEQVLTAMRIAGEKVRYAQQEVRGIGTAE
jgi:type VI protein secretion system component VasF